MFQALRSCLFSLLCLYSPLCLAQVPLIDFPDLTSITFHEQTGFIIPHTYNVNDNALTTQLPGQLNAGNMDFEGSAGWEFYDVFYSDADGTFNINGGYVSIECRFDLSNTGGALNINEVEFHFGSGFSTFGRYVPSYVSNGATYEPGSEQWTADCNLATHSTMGNTENTTIRLRVTIGILNAASTIIEETCSGSGFEVMAGSTLYNESNATGMEVLTAEDGCDSLVLVDITFHEVYTQNLNYSGCSGDGYSVLVGNTLYNETNPSGTEMLMTQAGCDSTIVIDLNFHPVYEDEINYQGCEGDGYSVIVNGTVYRESNPDGTEIMTTTYGCDSIVTIDLVFAPVSYTEIDYLGCSGDGYAVDVNGTIYDEDHPSGVEYLFSENGCDSIINIDLVFNPVQTTTETHTSCAGSGYSIVINGNTYDESHPSGTEWLSGSNGCDSVIQVALTFVQPTSQVISYTGCAGDGYAIQVNGTTYNEGNPAGQEMMTAVNGCDSIVNVALSFLPAITVNAFYTACEGSGFSLLINGTLYDETHPSGMEVLTSQTGCDSIIGIQIDFIAGVTGMESYSGCLGDGYAVTVNGTLYNELNPSGVETLTAQNGCDSIVTINLIFQNSVSVMHNYTGCAGDGYAIVINGNQYDETNPNGIELIPGSMGCDTIVTIALIFQPVQGTAIHYAGCEGDGYEVVVNGTAYHASNPQGIEIMTARNGCDSVITIDLVFLAATQHDIQYAGCLGDNYSIIVNGTRYDEQHPTGTEWLIGSNGCDSVVTVNLVFGNQFVVNENYSACEGDGYFIIVNGQLYDEQHPQGTESIAGVSGCDTLIHIDLTFAPSSSAMISYAGCSGDGHEIVVNGTLYSELNPNGVEVLSNARGCDSTITITLTFAEEANTSIDYQGCTGDEYAVVVNGSTYNESNPSGLEMMQNAIGCDSIVQIALVFDDCTEQELDCAIYIPNAISPNGDGINDAFSIGYSASCVVTRFRIVLFDRWGEEIFTSDDPFFSWKGDFRGKPLLPGVFVYVASIYIQDALRPVIRRGDVTVIR
jgi:gliding motility-associated-like protein